MFSKEGECVCVQVSGKNMGDIFFFFGFFREKRVVEGERGCGGHMFCDFFVCFWWFIGDRVF